MMDEDAEYEVGYGKPPVATRFRKGHSGNPKSRPKRARGVRALLETALAQQITITEGGRKSRISKSASLVLSLIRRATKADMRAGAQVIRLKEEQDMAAEQDGGGITLRACCRSDGAHSSTSEQSRKGDQRGCRAIWQ